MICGYCGSNVDVGQGYSFCPNCGKPLGAVMPESQPMPPSQSHSGRTTHAPPQQPYHYPQSPLPPPLQSSFVLRPGEMLLRLMNATFIGDPRGGEDDNEMSFSGVLIITDQRLSLAVLFGLVNKHWSVHKSIELSNVKGTEVRSGFSRKWLSIYTISNGVTYVEAWKDFYETDLNTLKRGRPLDLAFAQQVINDALGRRGPMAR